jgi:hypothetical protein
MLAALPRLLTDPREKCALPLTQTSDCWNTHEQEKSGNTKSERLQQILQANQNVVAKEQKSNILDARFQRGPLLTISN